MFRCQPLVSNITGAGLNVRGIFTGAFNGDLNAYSRKLEWSNGSGSDLFAILNAYRTWVQKHNKSEFGVGSQKKERENLFAREHSLDLRSLNDCHLLVMEIKDRLFRLGLKELINTKKVVWQSCEKSIILKVVIAGELQGIPQINSISFYASLHRSILPELFLAVAASWSAFGTRSISCFEWPRPK